MRSTAVRRRQLALAVTALVAVIVLALVLTSGSSAPRPAAGGAVARAGGAAPARAHPHLRRGARRHAAARRPAHRSAGAPQTDVARLLGQMIVARFPGPHPSQAFLARIRSGQIGGVILFSDNVAGGVAATRQLTSALQRAAAQGKNPPLLIMTDQEGGHVRRLPGPPSLAPADMTSTGLARAQGQAAGQLLRAAGIDIDLAPVADVEPTPNFLGSRAFGQTPATVAHRACAFAAGLSGEHVAYTLKHFPGLGLAAGNTDLGSVTVDAPASVLRAGYAAYRACGSAPLSLVMVSSAIYPALSGPLPAVMSSAIYHRELALAVPRAIPVTISDDLQSAAIESQLAPARRAIQAGVDLLMYAQTEDASAVAYSKLLAETRSGLIPSSRLAAASVQIRALKRRLVG